MLYFSEFCSPIGKITIVCNSSSIIGLWFKNQKYYLGNIKEKLIRKDDLNIIVKTKEFLCNYFNGNASRSKNLKLAPRGTPFQLRVWNELLKIPYGTTTTYGEIAKTLGNKMSAQAVGSAISHNPISIIIPCHRVIAADGSLTGYAGGLEKKKFLLELEGINIK